MANSLRESGSILADGTAWLIYTIFFILPPWLVFIVPGFWSGFGRGSAAARPSGAVEPPAVGERRGRTAAKGRRYFEGFRSGWLLRAAGAEQAQHHPGGSPVLVLGRAAKGGAVVVEIDHADFPVFPDAHIDSASGLIRKAVIRGSVASGAADGDVEARSANQAFHKRRYVPAAHAVVEVAAAEMVAVQNVLDADRKSTRLNSSHGYISYAVFCLKKKNINVTMRSSS